MKNKIHIDDEPFAETRYYSGVYSVPDGNDPKTEYLEYTFTISAQLDENSNHIFLVEITWTDNEPPDRELAEEQVKKFWHSPDSD